MISFGLYIKHHIVDIDNNYINTVYRLAYSSIKVESIESIEAHINRETIRTKLSLLGGFRVYLDEYRNHYITGESRLVDILSDQKKTSKCDIPYGTKTQCPHLYIVADNEIYIVQDQNDV